MNRNTGSLTGKVAVACGATYGVGRGVADELARHGARAFVTGRSVPPEGRRQGRITMLRCDHRNDDEVDTVFARVLGDGAVDILVNAVTVIRPRALTP